MMVSRVAIAPPLVPTPPAEVKYVIELNFDEACAVQAYCRADRGHSGIIAELYRRLRDLP